jgi:hypothetical protein
MPSYSYSYSQCVGMYSIPQLCDANGCENPSLFRFGNCVICWRHFCGYHLRDSQAHDCGKASKTIRAERQASNRVQAVSLSIYIYIWLMGFSIMRSSRRLIYLNSLPLRKPFDLGQKLLDHLYLFSRQVRRVQKERHYSVRVQIYIFP